MITRKPKDKRESQMRTAYRHVRDVRGAASAGRRNGVTGGARARARSSSFCYRSPPEAFAYAHECILLCTSPWVTVRRTKTPLRSGKPTHRQKRPVGLQHMCPCRAIIALSRDCMRRKDYDGALSRLLSSPFSDHLFKVLRLDHCSMALLCL